MKRRYSMIALALMAFSISSYANHTELHQFQQRWAEVNYTLKGDSQLDAFEQLAKDAKQWVQREPNNAEAHIWLGIIKSTQAGAEGGLSALGMAKEARKHLQQALSLDAGALDGSAYASLGTLYYKVPGWPFGFGDDDKAKTLLQKALSLNPQGIDPNYFYADYLYEQGEYAMAKQHAETALQAADRPERPLADKERRHEVQTLLVKINKAMR